MQVRRFGVVVLAALAPAASLAVDPAGLFPFTPIKWLVVTVFVLVGAALLGWSRPVRFELRPTAAVAALVGVLAVAAAVGEDPLYAWTGTPERHLGVVLWALLLVAFVAGQSLDADHDGPTIATGLLVAAAGVGIAGVLEGVDLGPDVLDAGSRLGSTFGSPAYLGAAACLLLPPSLALASRRRPLAIVAAVALGIATLGSGARAAWIGLAIAAALTRIARRSGFRVEPWKVAAALGVALTVLLGTPVGDRIAATFDADEPGGAGRLDEWRVATRVIADHPVLGVGPEGYRVVFAEGVDDAYEREHGRQQVTDRAHSAPLDIALAGGVPALVAWLAVLTSAGRYVWRSLADDRVWVAGMAAGLVAYLAGQLLLFPLAELEPIAALLTGLVVAATVEHRQERLLLRAAPVALVGVAAVALVAGALDIAADRRAEDSVEVLQALDSRASYDAAADAVALRPDEVRLHLLLAEAALFDDRGTVAALAAVDDALAISPGDPVALRRRAQLLVERASATLVPEHAEAALGEVERLLADDPSNGQLHALAATAHALLGDADAAATEAARARDLGFQGDGT